MNRCLVNPYYRSIDSVNQNTQTSFAKNTTTVRATTPQKNGLAFLSRSKQVLISREKKCQRITSSKKKIGNPESVSYESVYSSIKK